MKKFLLLMLAAATPAFAHAKLKASDPAADASVKSPNLIRLTFTEALEPAFSGAELADAAGKTIPVSKSVGGSSITLLPMGLKPGTYKVTWHSVGHDTHRISGSFSFKVLP
ncbi:MAG TPA: copper homeostasis periplasmic binding protein CopC [Rhizomicrobium sp.]|nr:copper homeostasis periplasmic binding protein CopC [Rhizomicrobium sp.]